MKAKQYKRVHPGKYVYSKIDTAAFFKVLEVNDGIATIEQIDNLEVAYLRGKCIYRVPVIELYNDYIQ